MNKKTAIHVAAQVFFCVTAAFAISWGSSLDSALKTAKSSNRPVMLRFYMDGCYWCDKLDDDTLSDSKVSRLAAQFVCVSINGPRERAISSKYGVNGYPAVIFLNGEGKSLNSVRGYVEAGSFAATMESVLKSYGASGGTAKPGPVQAQRKPAAPAKAQKKELKIPEIKIPKGPYDLTGILQTAQGPRAVINDAIVKAGDVVSGATVTEITAVSVKLSKGGKDIVVKLAE